MTILGYTGKRKKIRSKKSPKRLMIKRKMLTEKARKYKRKRR